jgi:hypothetical protein
MYGRAPAGSTPLHALCTPHAPNPLARLPPPSSPPGAAPGRDMLKMVQRCERVRTIVLANWLFP